MKTKNQVTESTKEEIVVVSYKGFDKNLCCAPNGNKFQYEVGKLYEQKGSISVCKTGFHACEFPLSVLSYYGLKDGNRYAVVEQSGRISKKEDKTASSKITVKAEIGIPGLIKASVEWVMANSATSGDYANSATSGNYAPSATSGNYANSATSGYYALSSAKGANAVAANAGNGAAMAGLGGAIFIVERDSNLNIIAVFSSLVGENGINADTWYSLKDGKPVECTP